jgi:alkylated DNA nucleotide flippase Atl1
MDVIATPRQSEGSTEPAGLSEFASRVLDVAESIPPGRVMSYGDIAEYVGEGGPRQVGRVMALWGGGVPWWRVVHADGRMLSGHEREALRHYRLERTPLRTSSDGASVRLDMRRARWPDSPGSVQLTHGMVGTAVEE